jgi:DnaJ like chaperone protein
MSIWSRIGDALSRVGGSLVEFLSGLVKPRPPEQTLAFTIGMIALAAKMAKADGVVTENEIGAFKRVFKVAPEEQGNVARVFNLAKQDIAGFDAYARQIARLFARRPRMLEDILDGLFHIAKADGAVHERELAYLMSVAEIFGFRPGEFARIRARHVAPQASDPYVVLGIDPTIANEDLRKAYRRLVRLNHPDRHIAAGMPEEAVKIATERLQRINEAYDRVAKERGI